MSQQSTAEEYYISIHALRVEGDLPCSGQLLHRCWHFYPRPPGGGRLDLIVSLANDISISIHALRVEGDSLSAFSLTH